MAFTVYNPKTKAYVAYDMPEADLQLTELLLVNILIELKVRNELAANSDNLPSDDDVSDIRNDVISKFN